MENNNYGLLLVIMDTTSQIEEEYNEWYDTEHLPERMSVPGFLYGARFTVVDGYLKHLAFMDLESLDVLKSDAYVKVSPLHPSPWSRRIFRHIRGFKRAIYQQIFPGDSETHPEANGVLLIEEDVEVSKENEINQWYMDDHIPRLKEMNAVLNIRRFVAPEGSPKFLTTYELSDLDLLQEPDFKKVFSDKTQRLGKDINNTIKSIYKKYHVYAFNHIRFFT